MTPTKAAQTPSLDLHAHLRGTFGPVTARRLARRNGLELPAAVFSADGRYAWTDFADFLNVYDRVGSVVAAPEDLAEIARSYLMACAAEGTVHIELLISPGHSIANGIPYRDQIEAIGCGVAEAAAATGISAVVVLTCVRHHGQNEALRIAELAIRDPHPLVAGFGMTGDERLFDPVCFRDAFALARSGGLRLTAHAGEWLDARSLLHTVDVLALDRVGHGIRAIEDRAVMAELAARGTGFEICLSSNVALGAVGSLREHPLPRLLEAGCRVALGTDDPAYFETSPAEEYRRAAALGDIGAEQIAAINSNALAMAFASPDAKAAISRSCGIAWQTGEKAGG